MTAALQAAKRLRAAFPVRTHRIKDDMPDHIPPGTMRPVIVAGERFINMTCAARALKVSPHTIYRMLDDGRAEYE